MEQIYKISAMQEQPFFNHVDYCIGTGRMGLALQKEYYDQLELVQKEIGFSHIRGHGLFCDDMAIYQEYEENGQKKAEYNFTYLDMVMDSYRKLQIRPFLELGFMPEKLASGTQTVFYWKGNVTPPADYTRWCDLVEATLRHLLDRYGEDVLTWPIEVWNEPNLKNFWENADKKAYFHLFEMTFRRIKEINPAFQVGGPAVCGGDDAIWIRQFLEFCREQSLQIDFITRHHYTTDIPEKSGHYGYAVLQDEQKGFESLQQTRKIIEEFREFRNLKLHITEFNTSYIPNCPLHDTNRNAAFIALQLSRLGDWSDSFSYWTFGDVFEEKGVPYTPFHGGFGLVANGGIPKPTFWTFAFFKKLQGTCIHRSREDVIVKNGSDCYRGIVWNLQKQEVRDLHFQIRDVQQGDYCILFHLVDREVCNPLKIWHDMGEPAGLSEEQRRELKENARPLLTTQSQTAGSSLEISCSLQPDAVLYFEAVRVQKHQDRGYDYHKIGQEWN